jgi:DNA-binding response OmpR family regulator
VSLKGKSVLVVKDHDELRTLVQQVFAEDGFQVRGVSEGSAALRLIAEESPDLTVLDLMLPYVNGIEILARMRQQPHLAEVPVVVTTGTATSAFDLRDFAPVHVMHKPLDVANLMAVARHLLDTP